MLYKYTIITASLIGIGIVGAGLKEEKIEVLAHHDESAQQAPISDAVSAGDVLLHAIENVVPSDVSVSDTESDEDSFVDTPKTEVAQTARTQGGVAIVPFYSQFNDISAPEWRKVGCGIASLAMLIEYYEPNTVSVDELLAQGIDAHAFLDDAGWTHAGLINLSHKYGLSGESHSLADSSMDEAFDTLQDELEEGPVMASVHYTFDPQNPIPHLVVVNGVRDGKVYYNDPSESGGGGTISIAKFQSSWKKRYIDIRPVS